MNYAIIAAGEGSRLRQEGVAVPKPLIDLDGRPMIGRLIDIFVNAGAETVSVIVNREMSQVRSYVEDLALSLPVELRLVVKSTPSSMHSFREVSRCLPEGKFILTTVDTVFRAPDFARYAKAWAESDADGLMAVTRYIDDEKPLYVDVDATERITAFRDDRFDGVRFVSGGIYGLGHSALDVLDRCIANGTSRMRNFQRALIQAGLDIRAYDFGKILDVDHQDDIRKAREFLNS